MLKKNIGATLGLFVIGLSILSLDCMLFAKSAKQPSQGQTPPPSQTPPPPSLGQVTIINNTKISPSFSFMSSDGTQNSNPVSPWMTISFAINGAPFTSASMLYATSEGDKTIDIPGIEQASSSGTITVTASESDENVIFGEYTPPAAS